MPYSNIHWIKLKLELLNDKRFIFDCNNDQKWLFVGLLLLAANTKNSIADDENFLKNRLNLPETPQKIRENLIHLFTTFPKLISKNGVIKFKNFNKLHNPLGTPSDTQWNAKGTPMDAVDKSRIDKIREEYNIIKGLDLKNYFPDDFARTAKAIKTLINKAGNKDELVLKALRWMATQRYEWTLETLVKKWADFMKVEELPEIERKWMKK